MCPRGCPNDATTQNNVHEAYPTHIILTMHALAMQGFSLYDSQDTAMRYLQVSVHPLGSYGLPLYKSRAREQ